MSYEERTLGWRGVGRAMERERVTRSNCDAGRFTRGPVLRDVPAEAVFHVVNNRIAAFCIGVVHFLDVTTGEHLTSVSTETMPFFGGIICDRWLMFLSLVDTVIILDCVHMSQVTISITFLSHALYGRVAVSGNCVSIREGHGGWVGVMRVQLDSDGISTVANAITKVELDHPHDEFDLVERGNSYLLYEFKTKTLRLMDLESRQCKRLFTPHAGYVISEFSFSRDTDFFSVNLSLEQVPFDPDEPPPLESVDDNGSLVFRVSDGHCMDQRFFGPFIAHYNGRCFSIGVTGYHTSIVDVITGKRVSDIALSRPMCDTSGAAIGIDRYSDVVMTSSGKIIDGMLYDEDMRLCTFQYGICIYYCNGFHYMLFFNQ